MVLILFTLFQNVQHFLTVFLSSSYSPLNISIICQPFSYGSFTASSANSTTQSIHSSPLNNPETRKWPPVQAQLLLNLDCGSDPNLQTIKQVTTDQPDHKTNVKFVILTLIKSFQLTFPILLNTYLCINLTIS